MSDRAKRSFISVRSLRSDYPESFAYDGTERQFPAASNLTAFRRPGDPSMLRLDQQSWIDYPPPQRAESPVQLVQGWYYIIVGAWVALAIGSLQSPVCPLLNLSHFWMARIIGVIVVFVGLGLIYASKKKEPFSIAIGAPIFIALLISVFEVIAIVNDALPVTFILDTAMQAGFLIWWAVAIYKGEQLVRTNKRPVENNGDLAEVQRPITPSA
jgi:hypothetical protein